MIAETEISYKSTSRDGMIECVLCESEEKCMTVSELKYNITNKGKKYFMYDHENNKVIIDSDEISIITFFTGKDDRIRKSILYELEDICDFEPDYEED